MTLTEQHGIALSVSGLSVCYGKTPALQDVSFSVADREFLAIVGPNGGGKTTLLRSIAGLTSYTGTITIGSQGKTTHTSAIGYVPQVSTLDRSFPIQVLDVVLTARLRVPCVPLCRYTKEDRLFCHELLHRLGLDALAMRRISELSGGEFQKMLLARALATKPRLLLLDEPSANADAVSRKQISDLLGELSSSIPVLLVTHDLSAITGDVHRVLCLNRTLLCQGDPQTVLRSYLQNGGALC